MRSRCTSTTRSCRLKWIHSFLPRRRFSSAVGTSSSTKTAQDVDRARAYCVDLLKKYDSPSYIHQTFIPGSTRDAYLAIRAFNISIASVADSVSNAAVGAIRLQFWRDAISKTYQGAPPNEPVMILLAHALNNIKTRSGGTSLMNQSWFLRIITAREQYLNNPPYPTLAALESYAESTYSTLLYLTLSALPLHSVTADHIASHIGKANGIVAVLRGLPVLAFPTTQRHHSNSTAAADFKIDPHAARPQGTVPLPLDIMAEVGLREEDIFREGPAAEKLPDAVFAVATRASDHLITAREILKRIRAGQDAGHEYEHVNEEGHDHDHRRHPSDGGGINQSLELDRAFGVFMPAVATGLWLHRLERVNFDIFHPSLRRRDWRLPWRSFRAFQKRQF
ncbi:MAG: NADH dehydrogenase (ubiquinone) complex I, assembly factor 6 [Watsoniomyces obsoletus]|nr:MAG: NADH dehydrogenase (ubiquinone) complex I, assembly factor 6 [Watsoniomyces obsoletus]